MKKIHRNNLIYIGLAVLLYYLQSIAGCGEPQSRIFTRTRLQMGSVITIKLVAENESQADRAFQNAFEEIERIEQKMSRRIKKSEIYKLNHPAGRSRQNLPVSRELYGLLKRSQAYKSATSGLFDFTIGKLTRLWGFENDGEKVPPADKISAFLEEPRPVVVKEGRVVDFLSASTEFDLGGVAKGYAVDRACQKLKETGVVNFIINAGGDIRLAGTKGKDQLWNIGIQDPRSRDRLIGSIRIKDRAIVTSGDYERFFIKNGKRYHHILDPRTGYPAQGCRSVTVVAGSTEEADALATGIFVMGMEDGQKFILNRPDIEGIIINNTGKMFISPGLTGKIAGKSIVNIKTATIE